MKRSIILAALTVLAAASCTKQEPVFVHSGNDLLSFSVAATKAADITTANLQSFSVTAHRIDSLSQKTTYFENVEFTKTVNGTFASAENYYWPAEGYLNIYAYAPNRETIPSGQVTRLDFNKFSVVPDKTASSATQADLVCFAGSFSRENAENGSVPLTFRHAESKIRLQVKNSSSTIKIEVDGWKIGGVAGSGVFTEVGGIDVNGFLSADAWTVNTEDKTEYVQNLSGSKKVLLDGISEARMVNNNLILIPQSVTEGAYIAVKMRVTNANDDALIKGNADGSGVWSTWPLAVNWTPGRSYTYVIDLAKAPIFGDDDTIGFVDVIVRNWDEGSNGDEGTIETRFPDYTVPEGVFTVSEDGRKVKFAKGNLFWNGHDFKLEKNQYDFRQRFGEEKDAAIVDGIPATTPYGTVGLFCWSTNVAGALQSSCGNSAPASLFTNKQTGDATGKILPNPDFTVEGEKGEWRTLSRDEWIYLYEKRTVKGGKGEGKSVQRVKLNYDETHSVCGLIIYPDGYTQQLTNTFGSWTSAPVISAIPEGCVFLPSFDDSFDDWTGQYLCSEAYKSSSTYGTTTYTYTMITYFFFKSYGMSCNGNSGNWPMAIRLVKDTK